MEYRKLGNSDLEVSLICLGTMTWGEQNSESEAFAQMDYAFAEGVNFFDTAEIYPVPVTATTIGRTESIIGNWLQKRGCRDQICLASKVCGPAPGMTHLRGGPRLTKEHTRLALDASLERLRTDCIDLYQIHWPARKTNFFGRLGYQYENDDDGEEPLEDVLEVLDEAVTRGKVRYIGLSNETPWGVASYLRLSERRGWPRVMSVQNPYSLLNRTFEVGLAEFACRDKTGLLAYSPLGFGVLSGKYLGGRKPENARLTLFSQFTRYTNPRAAAATERYVELAHEAGLDPAQMALAWINSRKFLTANIIGATTMEQLRANIASVDIKLEQGLLEKIDETHVEFPFPSP